MKTAMRTRKTAENEDRPQTYSAGNLAESLAALLSAQLEIGREAVRLRQKELAALVACQIFDAIDWARLNIGRENLDTLHPPVVARQKRLPLTFSSMEDVEAYAEAHFVGND